MTTILAGAVTIAPLVVEGYASDREGANVIHPILGRAEPDVTHRPAALRTGTLTLVFQDEAAAHDAQTLHAEGTVFVLTDEDRPTLNMTYVLGQGRVSLALDGDTRDVWLVTVDYQEVTG